MPSSLEIVRKWFPEVERVKDGTKDLSIEVTKADVRAASVKDHKDCALAIACRRALKLDGALVAIGRVYLIKDGEARRYVVPQHVSREIVALDRGGVAFAPGTYDLEKPPKIKPRGSGTRHKGDPRAGNRAANRLTAGVRSKLTAAA